MCIDYPICEEHYLPRVQDETALVNKFQNLFQSDRFLSNSWIYFKNMTELSHFSLSVVYSLAYFVEWLKKSISYKIWLKFSLTRCPWNDVTLGSMLHKGVAHIFVSEHVMQQGTGWYPPLIHASKVLLEKW